MKKLKRLLMRPFCTHDWVKCYKLGITNNEGKVNGEYFGFYCKKCGKLHSGDSFWLDTNRFRNERDAYFLKKDAK